MNGHRPALRPAFTLIEMIAVMSILAALGAVIGPLAWRAGDTFATASEQRDAMERCDFALRRIAELVREYQLSTEDGAAITIARPAHLAFDNGARIELLGSTLWMATSDTPAAPLCQRVEAFQMRYFAADGVTDASASPNDIRTIQLDLLSGGVELRTVVHRVELGSGS